MSFGVIAALRHTVPQGGRVALTTPVYPSFFEYLKRLGFDPVEIPLIGVGGDARLDLDTLGRAFAGDGMPRVHALILCNPHNPHGIAHSAHELTTLAESAAATGAFIVSDEIHAPLTHPGVTFTPFSPIAERAGARSVTVTAASKGWNIAGTKCALIYAPPSTAPAELREALDLEFGYATSILGVTASTVAYRDCVPWLDEVTAQISANAKLLGELLSEQVPGAVYVPPRTGYLAWIDLRATGLGDLPGAELHKRVLLRVNEGRMFGEAGAGHIRLNIGCSEALVREAVSRIARAVAEPTA